MPKRKRISQSVVSTNSSFPYSTNMGGRWLKKALDPADTDTDILGMPDTATNARCVINYAMQADVPPPETATYVPTEINTYDADIYLYQNPLIFSMSASYPQGTKDPSTSPIVVDWQHGRMTIGVGTAPRTVNVLFNDQIEGRYYKEKLQNWSKYCQRYRMIYGGVQAIPACSALYDSGTIEATQQIFNPQNDIESRLADGVDSAVSDIKSQIENITPTDTVGKTYWGPYTYRSSKGIAVKKQSFLINDFPDSGNIVQNPTALYCRYREGAYMPYKIRNPLVHHYNNSEDTTVVEGPYVMTHEAYFSWFVDNRNPNGQIITPDPTNTDAGSHTIQMAYDPVTRTYYCVGGDLDCLNENHAKEPSYARANGAAISIKCYSKLGIPFWARLIFQIRDTNNGGQRPDAFKKFIGDNLILTYNMPDCLPAYARSIDSFFQERPTDQDPTSSSQQIINVLNVNQTNPVGTSFEPTSVLCYEDSNIGIINFKSIAVQASVRLLFKLGFEMMVSAGGVYTPFKHKAPKYDEKAISSYIVACHNMRDAFLGNAATAEGHNDYTKNISSLMSSVANSGASWYGRVSI